MKLAFYTLHCAASAFGVDLSKDQVERMHMGPRINTNKSITVKGKAYASIALIPVDLVIGGQRVRTGNKLNFYGRGWDRPGYTGYWNLRGEWIQLTPSNEDDNVDTWEITYGVKGFNSVTRSVMYVGGIDKNLKPLDTRTPEQKEAMRLDVLNVVKQYPLIRVGGHNQFAYKACPSFDVPKWLREIGVQEKNICQRPTLVKF